MPSREGYAAVPNWIIDHPDISGQTMAVMLVLSRHHGGERGVFPSHASIAAKSGLGVSTVRAALSRMRSMGLIDWTQRTSDDGGQSSNEYRLLFMSMLPEEYAPPSTDVPPPAGRQLPPRQQATTPPPPVGDEQPKRNNLRGTTVADVGAEETVVGAADPVTQCPPFPATQQQQLIEWFKIGSDEGALWQAAWTTSTSVAASGTIHYDPEHHLASYLLRCKSEKRTPKHATWLRFYIEDRSRFIENINGQQDASTKEEQRQRNTARAMRQAAAAEREATA